MKKFALLAIALLAVTYVILSIAPDPTACPDGATYENSSLVEDCATPSGRVVCVISALGFAPTRAEADDVNVYSPNVPDIGPWCHNSRAFGSN